MTPSTRDGAGPAPFGAAAVVGARGFIGSVLLARLRAQHVSVSAFTRDVPFVYPFGHLDDDPGVPRTVFWLAGSTNPALAEQRPDLVDGDEAALAAMLDAVSSAARPPRVVLVSSGGTVYDPAYPPPYDEASPLGPTTAYGRAKVRLEAALDRSGLPAGCWTIVRVSNAYGPGQRVGEGQGVIAHWLHAAAHGDPLVLFGDPATVRDFVYVDDVADALVRLHRVPEAPPVVNVGSGEPTTLAELLTIVCNVAGRRAADVVTDPARTFDQSRTWLDVGRARRELGWRPATSLAAGIAATWADLVADLPAAATAPVDDADDDLRSA